MTEKHTLQLELSDKSIYSGSLISFQKVKDDEIKILLDSFQHEKRSFDLINKGYAATDDKRLVDTSNIANLMSIKRGAVIYHLEKLTSLGFLEKGDVSFGEGQPRKLYELVLPEALQNKIKSKTPSIKTVSTSPRQNKFDFDYSHEIHKKWLRTENIITQIINPVLPNSKGYSQPTTVNVPLNGELVEITISSAKGVTANSLDMRVFTCIMTLAHEHVKNHGRLTDRRFTFEIDSILKMREIKNEGQNPHNVWASIERLSYTIFTINGLPKDIKEKIGTNYNGGAAIQLFTNPIWVNQKNEKNGTDSPFTASVEIHSSLEKSLYLERLLPIDNMVINSSTNMSGFEFKLWTWVNAQFLNNPEDFQISHLDLHSNIDPRTQEPTFRKYLKDLYVKRARKNDTWASIGNYLLQMTTSSLPWICYFKPDPDRKDFIELLDKRKKALLEETNQIEFID